MVALDRALVFDGNRICSIPRQIAEKAGCTTGTECVVEGVPMDESTVGGQKVVVIENVSVTVLVPSR
jgi:hypothetical protein